MFWNDAVSPDEGPAKVLLKRGEFIDTARNGRVVPYKIYYPVDHGLERLPVVFWSHGFGGNKDGASFLSRFLASYGYVLVHMTHEGTDSSLWEGKGGHPWDVLRKIKTPRAASLNRFLDVPFVLDQLQKWTLENPDVGALMDFDALGISGHSFGALTTQVMAGQLYPNEDNKLQSLGEDRFKAGILYSPVPIAHLSDAPPSQLYNPIKIPLLHMTGTDDASPIEGFGYEHRLDVYDHTTSADKYLLVKKDGDHMVYNGTRGKLAVNPNRARHEEFIKMIALAFWEAQLKGDEKAQSWLSEQGAQTYIGEDAELKSEII